MNNLSNKIYNVKNNSDVADVYIGRSTIQGFRHSDQTYYYHHFNKNVKDTFLFSSIVGSKNVKLLPPSEETPFVQIDSRYYNFYNKDLDNPASFFSSISKNNETITVYFRSLSTDGSVFLKQTKTDKFLWDGKKFIEDTTYTNNVESTCTDGIIRVLVPDYKLEDNPVSATASLRAYSVIKDRVIDTTASTIKLNIKKLSGSKCIKVTNKNDRIRIDFDKVNCPCGNILYSSSSSSSSWSSSSNSSSSLSSNSSSSNSSSSLSNSSSSQSYPSSQSSQSSQTVSESSISELGPMLLCSGNLPIKKDAYVSNSKNVCIRNGRYINTSVTYYESIWEHESNPLFRIIVKKTISGEWEVKAESPEALYLNTLLPTVLNCDKGWISGVAPLHFMPSRFSSSSSSSIQDISVTSLSSSSNSSSSSSIGEKYKEFFSGCENPYCSSEYYCIHDYIDQWLCNDSVTSDSSFSLTSQSSSSSESISSLSSSSSSSDSSDSSSSSSLSSNSSSSSSSDSSSLNPTCFATILVTFG